MRYRSERTGIVAWARRDRPWATSGLLILAERRDLRNRLWAAPPAELSQAHLHRSDAADVALLQAPPIDPPLSCRRHIARLPIHLRGQVFILGRQRYGQILGAFPYLAEHAQRGTIAFIVQNRQALLRKP